MGRDALVTQGSLLNGRIAYRQLRSGHRTGIEPVLLAASIPAEPGAVVAEGGTGAGAGLLCLASRVPGVIGIGIEADPALAALAATNVAANPAMRIEIRNDSLPDLAKALPMLDHAFANPPWFAPDDTSSPDTRRALARQGTPALIGQWAACLARSLRRGGTLTLIVPARLATQAAAAIGAASCGGIALFPLWPHEGVPARIAILRGIRSSSAPFRIEAGLVLHRREGGYTDAAEHVLRDGGATF